MLLGALAACGTAAVGSETPSGPPTNASTFNYGDSKVGVQWANGDEAASTQVGYSAACSTKTVSKTLPPGVTSFETGTTNACNWWLRHIRDGTPGDWVQVLEGVEDCDACPA